MLRADLDYTLDVDAAGHAVLAHGEPPATWVCPGQSPEEPSAPASTTVPALTVQDPTVHVSPSTGLHDGQTITVAVTGFGVGAKVWLSECASATDVSGEGCGAQLAAQTLLATGDDRSGSTTFVVHRDAATEAVQAEPTATCTNDCVIVATQGDRVRRRLGRHQLRALSTARAGPASQGPQPNDDAAECPLTAGTSGPTVALEGWADARVQDGRRVAARRLRGRDPRCRARWGRRLGWRRGLRRAGRAACGRGLRRRPPVPWARTLGVAVACVPTPSSAPSSRPRPCAG